ncbi:MAG: phosphoribosylformimino-5-aminoimidazole carboxamide ribotide isomerase [Lachnospiraceae bacterium]|nr:phosphoribosylformimino-5-aminoimidazole carboxamide ribotide isomerase [Lachnospiraceae bacterium]
MRFRPCIDIHDGKVKQIVGGSLETGSENGPGVKENFVSHADASFYAALYRERGLAGGHIILLNQYGTAEYADDKRQAAMALKNYPGGFQLGGGITAENAVEMLNLGASHVIVTSYVFADGCINYDNLKKLKKAVGREHIVLDMSCRMRDDSYYIVTDRWKNFTKEKLTAQLLDRLSEYCDEYLVHAVDVEGHQRGIEAGVAGILGSCDGIMATYAGGIASLEDIGLLGELGNNRVDFTVGSALDIFGGSLRFDIISAINKT